MSIVNVHGFRRGSRYLPDRRDLNRHFPGRERGSAASRIARVVFDGMVRRCDFLLDFHTGSFQRANLPHVRGDLSNPRVRELAEGLGGWLVLDHPGTVGTLRRAASDAGVPTITFEVGGPYRLEPVAVDRGTAGVAAILAHMGLQGRPVRGEPEVVTRSRWVRVDDGGLLFTHVQLGQSVSAGELLGMVVEPTAHERSEVRSPWSGRVIGMAWQQVVIPGFAAFHVALGEEASQPDVAHPDADDDDGVGWSAETVEGVDSEEVPE
jgi:predicted deacylase